MAKQYKKALVIFRRDLRITDNTAALHAAELAETVIPCFILDPRQVAAENKFRSMNAIQFMLQALEDLDAQLRKQKSGLLIRYGKTHEVIKKLIAENNIDAVFVNRDYTPFSINRDELIKKECLSRNIAFYEDHDLLLHEPEEITSLNGTPYAIFTPFFKRACRLPIRQPSTQKINSWAPLQEKSFPKEFRSLQAYKNPQLHVPGSRAKALKILASLEPFVSYGRTHDLPALHTTNLSAYIKFGLVSIREVYQAMVNTLGTANPLIRQLYWRDFFTHVAYFSPFVFGQPFKERYKGLAWDNDLHLFQAWCNGQTGFPIIDAGMRQLNQTGYMHNRVRLLVASFLIKDLHIDWQWGERYFAQKLLDYDPAVNNGNWQWVASTGTDSQPYFRIFNPWLQQKKFDPECTYIKRWVPELQKAPNRLIHTWASQKQGTEFNYPNPLVDHAKEAAEAKKRYKIAK